MPDESIPSGHTFNWEAVQAIPSQRYPCGYCGSLIATDRGWQAKSTYSGRVAALVCICHNCHKPTFIDNHNRQTPGVTFGNSVQDVPDQSVSSLYDEARKAAGAGCYTAAVLACRKLLMHIAVEKGAKEGASFVSYVEYLADNNFIPPDARPWVDHIRTRGNEANHEIAIMGRGDSEELLSFSEMLLKVIYEFPAAIRKRTTPPTPPAAA